MRTIQDKKGGIATEGIRTCREAANLNMSELARKLGVTPAAVFTMEQPGKYPDAARLPAIADALDTSIDALFGRGDAARRVVAPYKERAVEDAGRYGDAGGEAPACREEAET